MTVRSTIRIFAPGQIAALALASALTVSAAAQQPANGSSAPAATQPSPSAQTSSANQPQDKEGFWGHVNPFARKKWVNKRLDPIKGQLNELDEVNAKNANDIKDVDSRAQAGINKAQSTADAANQTATAAGSQAQQANLTASQAGVKVASIDTTVNGLDNYTAKNTVSIKFRPGSTVLSKDDKEQLDQLAANLTGHQGYVLEIAGYSPLKGSAGIQNSDRIAEAVKRYLVTEHEIPVYRLHSVALGNMPAAGSADADQKIRTNHVELRLMENSLAAQDGQTPRLSSSQTGASQP